MATAPDGIRLVAAPGRGLGAPTDVLQPNRNGSAPPRVLTGALGRAYVQPPGMPSPCGRPAGLAAVPRATAQLRTNR